MIKVNFRNKVGASPFVQFIFITTPLITYIPLAALRFFTLLQNIFHIRRYQTHYTNLEIKFFEFVKKYPEIYRVALSISNTEIIYILMMLTSFARNVMRAYATEMQVRAEPYPRPWYKTVINFGKSVFSELNTLDCLSLYILYIFRWIEQCICFLNRRIHDFLEEIEGESKVSKADDRVNIRRFSPKDVLLYYDNLVALWKSVEKIVGKIIFFNFAIWMTSLNFAAFFALTSGKDVGSTTDLLAVSSQLQVICLFLRFACVDNAVHVLEQKAERMNSLLLRILAVCQQKSNKNLMQHCDDNFESESPSSYSKISLSESDKRILLHVLERNVNLQAFTVTACSFFHVTRATVLKIVRLIALSLWELHQTGTVEVFGFFGLILWSGIFTPLIFYDFIFLQSIFLRTLFRTLDTCEKVWNRAKLHLERENGMAVTNHLKFQKDFNIWILMIHTGFIDYISLINLAWSSYQNIENDPTLIYSSIPWKNPVVDVIYWCLQQINLITLCAAWSLMLTFPGLVAYYLECVLRALTKSIEIGPTKSYTMEAIKKDYNSIEFAVRELHRNGLSNMLLIFYMTCAIQQTIESFCIFRLIKLGATWDDYQFFLIDILFTTGRVFHGVYALSRVDHASQAFLNAIRTRMAQNAGNVRMRSMKSQFLKTLLMLKPVRIQIGPCSCSRDLPLSGGALYMDNIVTTALWP
ncbi:unnamed protein product [Orchesella dallaii]|uniref:Gustatory receptor n=1 Tax=Orchesella dallaii TaxID=48710 RepID=A0ABP1R2I0_9HEXA